MNNPIKGIVVPAVTPYRDDLTLDLEGAAAVFAYFDRNPHIDGLFITGATGEYDALTLDERKQIIDLAIDMNMATDWLPNTSSLDIELSLELTRYAVSRGVGTIGVIFPKACQTFAAVQRFLEDILSLGPQVFIYQTGNSPYPLAVSELAELVRLGSVVGIKDSCSPRDFYRHIQYVSQLGDQITVIQGVEMLYLPSLSMGVQGVIGGGCNVYPELLKQIQGAYGRGDNSQAARLQKQVNELIELLSLEGTANEAMKFYLSLCGVPIGTASRKSQKQLSAGKMEKIRALHQELSEGN